MNRTLLLPLSACLLFASCVTTYSTSRKYVAVDTPEGETVVMNGDTLRYGLTPRDMALELGVEPSGKNLARMSRIVYAANSPQTAYGFYDATPEPLSVEIHAADTTYSYRLAAYNSDLFWLNFLSLGIGMFEDRGNNNRYEHPDLYWTGDGYRTFRKNDWTLGVRPRYRSVLKATERRGGAVRHAMQTRSRKDASTFRWPSRGCNSIRFLPFRQEYAETTADVSESPQASNTSTATSAASHWKQVHWPDMPLSGDRLPASTRRPTKNGLPYTSPWPNTSISAVSP